MITEDYVSFETAKLLKEKGFNELTPLSYSLPYGYESHIPCSNGVDTDFVSRITLQMAMKWLRDVHKIFLNINFIPEHFCFTYRIVHNGVEEKFVVYPSTYEEACEAAIKYCLENFI